MKRTEGFRISPLRRYRTGITYAFLCFGCVAGVFLLYRLECEALWYSYAVCALIGAVFMLISAAATRRRVDRIRRSCAEADEKGFPHPLTAEEAEYRELLGALQRENYRLREEQAETLRTLQDDYTLWTHQIKTPIAALRLLLAAKSDPDAREAELELQRIADYVEMALSVQRLSGDSGDLYPKEYELDTIIRKAVKKYSRLFIRKRLYLRFEALHTQVITDEKWLSFILEQVLTNALKYTERGGIDIYLDNGRLVIADTGCGIAPEELPRVFERGYTGYNGRMEAHATGIGLYLCRKAARMLGHTITITSQIGIGTCVYIDFTERMDVE